VSGDEEIGKALYKRGKRSEGCPHPLDKDTLVDWARKGNITAQQC